MRLSCGVIFLFRYLVAIKARTVTELVLAKLKIKPPWTGDFMGYQATKEYLMVLYDRPTRVEYEAKCEREYEVLILTVNTGKSGLIHNISVSQVADSPKLILQALVFFPIEMYRQRCSSTA